MKIANYNWHCAILCFLFVPSFAEEPDDPAAHARPLAEEREHDQAWGVSLRPPVGAKVLRQAGGRYLMQLLDDQEQFKMFVSVKRVRQATTLDKIARDAKRQLASIHTSAELFAEDAVPLADRPGVVIYFLIPPPDPKSDDRLILGQAFVQIANDTFVVVEVEGKVEDELTVRGTFGAVLKTLEVRDVGEVQAERRAQTERSRDLLKGLDPEVVHAALVEEQLFRVVSSAGGEGKPRDIGWMRVRQGADERVGKPGVGVEVQTRITVDDTAYDSLAHYYVADDDTYEDWTVTTTERPPGDPAGDPADPKVNRHTTFETGTRTANKIEVKVEAPTGTRKFTHLKPDFAYLSQAGAWLVPQLLPGDTPTTYGFYGYNAAQGKVTYRTDKVVPTLDGFTLLTVLSPNDPPLKSTYGQDRRLRSRQLSETHKLLPTTPEELKKIWPKG